MNSKECELQLNQLIIDWDEDRATRLNATDIKAIKHLMLENQMQQDHINTLKNTINDIVDRHQKVKSLIYENLFDKEEKYHYAISESTLNEVTDKMLQVLDKGDKECFGSYH